MSNRQDSVCSLSTHAIDKIMGAIDSYDNGMIQMSVLRLTVNTQIDSAVEKSYDLAFAHGCAVAEHVTDDELDEDEYEVTIEEEEDEDSYYEDDEDEDDYDDSNA